ncbi:nucleotidyl transferase AbiEii/AbiGii toxin family protein [Yersinia ruckeri]|uniref:nucleotidyl transferase AbiEii/AbiGii toxin family protein n=1 Tax=Yersinia ruckeri TaxID=29486 RepID=UPI002238E582|nr:nucleotidyl transferase AbiEii/AbiGii toxin family protein [Yersinia ruckeri]MCW6598862.1 nucleotidyl transferase AbiEii/AbiGii toxin family protein [Yersinia ruckeri]
MVDKISPEEQAKIDAAVKELNDTKKKMVANFDKILTDSQKVVEPNLKQITDKGFVLAGGLAVGANTGHRKSDDFDFFGKFEFDPEKLKSEFDFSSLTTDHTREAPSTLEYFFSVPQGQKTDIVKVSMFGRPNIQFETITDLNGYTFAVATPLDMYAAKLAAITTRDSWKDYSDLAALIRFSGFSLLEALDRVPTLFSISLKDAPSFRQDMVYLLSCAHKVKGVRPDEITAIEKEMKRCRLM